MYCYHCTTCTKPGQWAVMCIVTITLPVQSQDNERNVYCYHYATCTKPGQWEVMRIVTITLPVQSQGIEWSCVLLPLHYLCKARKMSGHVCCYHYTTCTKPGKWAVMFIVTITLPVQGKLNERSCVLLPLHYLCKARTMSVMRIVTITLPVQSQDNERSCVLLPLHYLYKAMKMSGHVCCYHYTTCTKPGQWASCYCYHYTTCTKPGK